MLLHPIYKMYWLEFFYKISISAEIFKELILRESLNKFPDFFRMGTFIDSTHMKL